MTTYEEFVAAVESRPSGQSPLIWMASLNERPAQTSEWMLRWLRESRS